MLFFITHVTSLASASQHLASPSLFPGLANIPAYVNNSSNNCVMLIVVLQMSVRRWNNSVSRWWACWSGSLETSSSCLSVHCVTVLSVHYAGTWNSLS